MLTKKQILESLACLTPEDRGEVATWCEALGARSTAVSDNEWADYVYEEISRNLSAYYRTSYPASLFVFSRAHGREYKKLLRATQTVVERIDCWWPDQNKTTKVALIKYLSRLTFDVVTRRSLRVSWSVLLDAFDGIEATINDAFPGWLRAGIFQKRALARLQGEQHVRPEPDSPAASGRRTAPAGRVRLSHHPR